MIERFMGQLAIELELPQELQPKSPGTYIFPLDEDLSITISEVNTVISFHSVVADCPKVDQEQFYQSMLLANLFGQGTYGAILGLSEESKSIILHRTLDYPVDYRQFRDVLEDFINAVDFWRQEATPSR